MVRKKSGDRSPGDAQGPYATITRSALIEQLCEREDIAFFFDGKEQKDALALTYIFERDDFCLNWAGRFAEQRKNPAVPVEADRELFALMQAVQSLADAAVNTQRGQTGDSYVRIGDKRFWVVDDTPEAELPAAESQRQRRTDPKLG